MAFAPDLGIGKEMEANMTVSVGDVVRFANGGANGDLGRVCKDNGFTVNVNFRSGGCLRVAKAALETTTGSAPDCDKDCGNAA